MLIYGWYVLRIIICIPVLPIIYYLGVTIKRGIPDLPEASRNIKGSSGNDDGKKLLLIGESSISAVGIEDHEDGIPGEIGRIMARQCGQSIRWEIVAKSGFRAIDVIEKLLPNLPRSSADLLIVGMGGNDTFKLTPPWVWRKNMKIIIRELRTKYPGRKLLICAMPPVADFPVFPGILKSFMGGHTNILRNSIRDFPSRFEDVFYLADKVRMKEWLSEENSMDMADFFSDGVHPSALTYQLIGRAIASKIIDNNLLTAD